MEFTYKYGGESQVRNSASGSAVSFAPDLLREPTYFVGQLNQKINFREAISALHDVVVADFKYRPKDRDAYRNWLKDQEQQWLADLMSGKDDLEKRIKDLRGELSTLRKERQNITAPYYKAQRKYFNYLYQRDYQAWYVLDPVITVHPDQVFFECFSKDESVYGKLSCDYNVFDNISDFKCGTTNIDYSQSLYDEFQKIRNYRDTEFKIDPSGFEVKTSGEEDYKEEKIDLPDSWVRGFLQVSSAMAGDRLTFDLNPRDIANFIYVLKRNKERQSPRSIRYVLKPGQPIKAIFEPWNHEVECPGSVWTGSEAKEVRVWGRRRLLLLERLLPIAKRVTVTLLGNGMPSFYTVHLNDMYFTLGLSGWTANDWTQVSQMNLLAPKGEVLSTTLQSVYLKLREHWYRSAKDLSAEMNLPELTVKQALSTFVQAGKVVYDLKNELYRIRELKREGIDIEELRFSSQIDRDADRFVRQELVRIGDTSRQGDKTVIVGDVDGHRSKVVINADLHISDGTCNCTYYYRNKLSKGPCEHILALRMEHERQTELAKR